MAEDLKIIIGADTKGAEEGINKVKGKLKELGGETSSSSKKITELGTKLSDTGQRISSNLSTHIRRASVDLLELGRGSRTAEVALESLGGETAAVSGAFLGITAAIAIFGISIANLFGAFKTTKEDLEKLKKLLSVTTEEQKKYNEEVKLSAQYSEAGAKAITSQIDKYEDLKAVLIDTNKQLSDISSNTIKNAVAESFLKQRKDIIDSFLAAAVEQDRIFRKFNAGVLAQGKLVLPLKVAVDTIGTTTTGAIITRDKTLSNEEKTIINLNKTKDAAKNAFDVINALSSGLDSVFKNLTDKPDKVTKKIKEQEDAVRKLKKAFLELPSSEAKLDAFNGPTVKGKAIGTPLVTNFSADFLQAQALFLKLQESAKKTADIFNSTLGPAISSAFTAAIEGSKSFGQAFTQALRGIVVQLIATIAKALILAAILTATGFSKLGFGKSFTSLLGGGKGFAGGGVASGPSTGYLALLHGTEAIFNESQMKALAGLISGGGQQTFIADNKLSGEDLYTSFIRVAQRRGRNF